MKKKILKFFFLLIIWLSLAGMAQAYQIDFFYEANANKVWAFTEHNYDLDFWDYDMNHDFSQGRASTEAQSPWESPSAIAQAVASPIGPGPVAEVSLKVTEKTHWCSYAYGSADTTFNFTILRDSGDPAGQVPVNFVFHVYGNMNLQGGAYYSYSYGLWLNGVNLNERGVYDYGEEAPMLNDLFITTIPLEVGVPHKLNVRLEGSLDHESIKLNWALYQANLDIKVHHTPLPPSFLLLGSGLLGLVFFGSRRIRWKNNKPC